MRVTPFIGCGEIVACNGLGHDSKQAVLWQFQAPSTVNLSQKVIDVAFGEVALLLSSC